MAPKWVLCSFGMISECLRNCRPPKWSVFYQACECKVTTRKRGIQVFCKFVAFQNVKIGSLPQCLRGKFYFFCSAKVCRFQKVIWRKNDRTAKLTIEARKRPVCTLLVTVKKWPFGAEWRKKWLFSVCNLLEIRALKVVISKKSFVICHFSINW